MAKDSLKKCYRSIPMEDRLPIGTVGSDYDELSSAQKESEVVSQQCDKPNEFVKQICDIEGNLLPIFGTALVPIEKSLPSSVLSQKQSNVVQIIQCRQERSIMMH